MRWMGGRRGGGIEDRRGLSGGGMAAGGGIGVIIISLIGYFVFGIDPFTTQRLASQFGGAGSQERGDVGTPEDQAGQFVDVVGTNVNEVWSRKLQGYTPPKVVIYTGGTGTQCGYGQAAMGPFYCPNDSTVYLDLSFWETMSNQLDASKADFAKAYVIAHEIGHHVQTLTGASQKVRQAQQSASGQGEANKYSVALELQADCYAGVWARNAPEVSGGEVALDPGEFAEGLKTANAIGDDTLQKRGGAGRVNPENFTHGSSAERMEWLQRGYDSGNPATCDQTFTGL
jgi:uncharacterized protein